MRGGRVMQRPHIRETKDCYGLVNGFDGQRGEGPLGDAISHRPNLVNSEDLAKVKVAIATTFFSAPACQTHNPRVSCHLPLTVPTTHPAMSTPARSSPPLASDTVADLLASGALTDTHHAVKTCSYPACGATGPSKTLATACGHVFHHGCLAKHLERSDACPHCRTNLSAPPPPAPASASDSFSSSSSDYDSDEDAFLYARREARAEAREIRYNLRKKLKAHKTRKAKAARKARIAEAEEALQRTTINLNNGSMRLHYVGEAMQRAAREMEEVTRGVWMETARRREKRKRLDERVAREGFIAKIRGWKGRG